MRLSTVFELLLILLLVAFAAWARVIDRDEVSETNHRTIRAISNKPKRTSLGVSAISLKQATDNVNRYCTCNDVICNCCRDFHMPLVQLKGPGCASLQYLKGDNLAVQLSFGDNILTSTIVNGKNPKPICVPLPGGISKFCGRIYSIEREPDQHFKACLGLELESATELEASLRVSCFRFGPDGLKLRPSEPLPVVEAEASPDEYDDDDFFGLGGPEDDDDDDDDDDDQRQTPLVSPTDPDSISSISNETENDEEDDDDDDDVLGFGALFDIFSGDDESSTKKPKPQTSTIAPLLHFTIPMLARPSSTSSKPVIEPHNPPNVLENTVPTGNVENIDHYEDSNTEEPYKVNEESTEQESLVTENQVDVSTTAQEEDHPVSDEKQDDIQQTEQTSNKIVHPTKPTNPDRQKPHKGTVLTKKKPTITSTSINAINDDTKNKKKKPLVHQQQVEDDDDDDDDDILGDDDDEEEELEGEDEEDNADEDGDDNDKVEDNDKPEEEHHDEDDDEDHKAEEIDDLDDDDDDEEEDAVIGALVEDEKEQGKKHKTKKHKHSTEDDSDYSLEDLLARSRHRKSARQSRIMRL